MPPAGKGPQMPLTDPEVKNAKPRAKHYKLADGGMFMLVNPDGAKYWRLKYRVAGREKKLSLGVYPEVTLKEARDNREAARALIREGKDPSAERKADKHAAKLASSRRRCSAWVRAEAVGGPSARRCRRPAKQSAEGLPLKPARRLAKIGIMRERHRGGRRAG